MVTELFNNCQNQLIEEEEVYSFWAALLSRILENGSLLLVRKVSDQDSRSDRYMYIQYINIIHVCMSTPNFTID